MKFITTIKGFFSRPANLALWTGLALIIPNLVLDLTETWSVGAKVANTFLPMAFYLLALSAWKRVGITVWLLFPFMFLAGFQLVLSSLYGESIIAVDMFLNVVTTNASEATELLRNLVGVMVCVILLYIPALIWATVAICRKRFLFPETMRHLRVGAILCAVVGGAGAICGAMFDKEYSFVRETFPVNVIENLKIAVERTRQTEAYPVTSKDFTYGARSLHDPEEKEIYVYVIGETSRAIDWQLMGYGRPTNPRLLAEENIMPFTHSFSESNTTHKSVPMLMSYIDAESFDSIPYAKSIITAFKEAGFKTRFISNQRPNHSFTQFFGEEADSVTYIDAHGTTAMPDGEVLPIIAAAVADTTARKQFIVVHSYGSHFMYRDRYPDGFARFLPDDAPDATAAYRNELINAYDNSILYTDHILAEIIGILKKADARTALFYSADHGEDIFDDKRGRFLHASPNPTYYQLHVASLCWLSDSIKVSEPAMFAAVKENSRKFVSPQKSLFPTALQIAGIDTPRLVDTLSLASANYRHAPAVYLNDLNRSLPLLKCGIKDADRQLILKSAPLDRN